MTNSDNKHRTGSLLWVAVCDDSINVTSSASNLHHLNLLEYLDKTGFMEIYPAKLQESATKTGASVYKVEVWRHSPMGAAIGFGFVDSIIHIHPCIYRPPGLLGGNI